MYDALLMHNTYSSKNLTSVSACDVVLDVIHERHTGQLVYRWDLSYTTQTWCPQVSTTA
jgi:hypothetical protein